MGKAPGVLAVLVLALGAPARAYETDQLTDRHVPLLDARTVANAKVDEILDLAAADTNRLTACRTNDDKTRKVLARRIFRYTARRQHVPWRGPVRGFGFGTYSAWLESAPIDLRTFPDRGDIYGGIAVPDSVILGAVGPCSTLNLAGVLLGTDKIDHFWTEGLHYAERSGWGERPERAIRFGTGTERSYYGMMTSNAFSYADLRANWDGYRFYVGLLGADSVLQRGEDGCVERVAGFDWAAWIDWEYDEVLNPPVFAPRVQAALEYRLKNRRDEYCDSWDAWGVGFEDHLHDVLAAEPVYVSGRAPARRDPYDLPGLCGPLGDE